MELLFFYINIKISKFYEWNPPDHTKKKKHTQTVSSALKWWYMSTVPAKSFGKVSQISHLPKIDDQPMDLNGDHIFPNHIFVIIGIFFVPPIQWNGHHTLPYAIVCVLVCAKLVLYGELCIGIFAIAASLLVSLQIKNYCFWNLIDEINNYIHHWDSCGV